VRPHCFPYRDPGRFEKHDGDICWPVEPVYSSLLHHVFDYLRDDQILRSFAGNQVHYHIFMG
jgi:hypothetical protein